MEFLSYEMLKFTWWVLIGALLVGFAITDGMDMGVGTLLPFIGQTDDERRVIINTVGPHWDGNQVWLITAGGAIFAAWPAVYGAAFSGFYFAMLLTLFALFFRPVGFDYRSKIADPRWRNGWDWGLFTGSLVPPLVFGIAFGNLLLGVPFHLDEFQRAYYTGSFFGLFNLFGLLAGLVSVSMVIMHGAIWLQLRTEGVIAARAARVTQLAGLATFVFFSLAGLWLAKYVDGYVITQQPDFAAVANPLKKTVEVASGAWLSNYQTLPWTMVFPVLGLAGALLTVVVSRLKWPLMGFLTSSLALAGIIVTAGVSMFPFVMPSSTQPNTSLTIWDAASSQLTLTVMFWATAIFLPIVIGYTAWCYYRMRGKVTIEVVKSRGPTAY